LISLFYEEEIGLAVQAINKKCSLLFSLLLVATKQCVKNEDKAAGTIER